MPLPTPEVAVLQARPGEYRARLAATRSDQVKTFLMFEIRNMEAVLDSLNSGQRRDGA